MSGECGTHLPSGARFSGMVCGSGWAGGALKSFGRVLQQGESPLCLPFPSAAGACLYRGDNGAEYAGERGRRQHPGYWSGQDGGRADPRLPAAGCSRWGDGFCGELSAGG